MTVSHMLRATLLSTACLTGSAYATGLGEITLHSRIDQPLRAEIPILAEIGNTVDAACFSLDPVPGADLPVITRARLRVVRVGQHQRLIITGGPTIDEPVFMLRIRMTCGTDLQRDYVLLPAPPEAITLPQAIANETQAPAPAAAKRPLRQSPPISDEGPVVVTKLTPPIPPPRARHSRRPPSMPGPLPLDTLAGLAAGKDRIVLGTAPEDSATGDTLAAAAALEDRVLKLETSLHRLDQQIDKLGAALTLGAESRTVRQQLAAMQKNYPNDTPVSAPAASPKSGDTATRWLELLFGVLLGGSVSAGIAHWVNRQDNRGRPFEALPQIGRPAKAESPRT